MQGRLKGVREGLIMDDIAAYASAGEGDIRHARALASAVLVEGDCDLRCSSSFVFGAPNGVSMPWSHGLLE